MLKVLVVDDEKLVRQMVMRCIDWKGIGLEIVNNLYQFNNRNQEIEKNLL